MSDKPWLRAAALGARVFLVYGIVETTYLVVVRWLVQPTDTYRPLDVSFALGCMVLYAMFGAGLGLIARAIARAAGVRFLQAPKPAARSLTMCAAIAVLICLSAAQFQPTLSADRAFPQRAAAPDRPNVVMLVLDTVTAAHLSLYGYSHVTSPHLSEIAAGATRYTNALSTSNYTLASTASIFTGRYAGEHGARFWDNFGDAPLPQTTPVLAELLGDAGYATAGIIANTLYLGRDFGLSRGFQHYDARSPAIKLPGLFPRVSLRALLHRAAVAMPRFVALTKEFRAADEITRSATKVIDDPAFRSGPFFLFVNYMDAHDPYVTGGYDEGIQAIDTGIAALVAHLQTIGAYDNTLLIITSDHGESFGEHGEWQHPASLYEPQIHVPLIIKWPHQRAGTVVDGLTSGVDLMPTVLAAAGLPVMHVSGRDLAAPPPADRAIFAEDFYGNPRAANGGTPSAAIIAGALKLIQYSDGRREMFDRITDRAEAHNLIGRDDPAEHALVQALAAWRRTAVASPPRDRPNRTTIDRLRALGYVR